MLIPNQTEDDRKRGSRGLALSTVLKTDGTLRLSVDSVVAVDGVSRNDWRFSSFNTHFDIDQRYLDLIEREMNRPENERSTEGVVSDVVLAKIGEALIVSLTALALDARKAGPV